jgi:hypothetical protein
LKKWTFALFLKKHHNGRIDLIGYLLVKSPKRIFQ